MRVWPNRESVGGREEDFLREGTVREKLTFLLQYAVLAPSGHGMPGYAFGMSEVLDFAVTPVFAWVLRTFDVGKGQAAKDRELAPGSPTLAVLGTKGDSPGEWLSAGQALARVLLRAAADGVAASFLNQAVEIPELRLKLGVLLGTGGSPQLVLRMGYGPETKPTPRRSVHDVLVGGTG